MFLGEHHHSLDPKWRVIFPSRMREELGSPVVVQKGQEACLYVYPMKEWERQVERVRSLPQTRRDARHYARFFFSQASPAVVDGQGRLTIPNAYREYAALDKDVVVVGNGDRVEIWEPARWGQHRDQVEAEIDVTDLGI